jgi:hypothetical protein
VQAAVYIEAFRTTLLLILGEDQVGRHTPFEATRPEFKASLLEFEVTLLEFGVS